MMKAKLLQEVEEEHGIDQAMTVTELTNYLKGRIGEDPKLQHVHVIGEVTNLAHANSGHIYFSIKDTDAVLDCAFFRGRNRHIDFDMENGLEAVIIGNVDLYEKRSTYQIIVTEVVPVGEGKLFLQFKQLKKKLKKEGMFYSSHKKDIPIVPKTVALITSEGTKAYHDALSTMREEFPHVTVQFYDASTQGEDAPREVAEAIEEADADGSIDTILVTRGGGSFEDLMAFNNEALVRTIHAADTPVVTAIGHETDTTIADYVADRSEPTPTAGADAIVPNAAELFAKLNHLRERLDKAWENYTDIKKSKEREAEAQRYKRVAIALGIILLIVALLVIL